MLIPEIHVEDPEVRTVVKQQYGVRLTYNGGRVTYHLRQSRHSAEVMVRRHGEIMRQVPQWQVIAADLAERDLTITIGDWRESTSDTGE